MALRIVYQDQWIAVIDKPAGYHVHPPEKQDHKISGRINCLAQLRDQLGHWVYPVHRIDPATTGLVLYAKTPEAAGQFSALWTQKKIQKTYFAWVRGWLQEDRGLIVSNENEEPNIVKWDFELPIEDHQREITRFAVIGRNEWNEAPQKSKHPTTRTTLLWVSPVTGRWHQIRRHMYHLGKPILGDKTHGDRTLNRFIKEAWDLDGMFLKAYSLEFHHPYSGEKLFLRGKWGHSWQSCFSKIEYCPNPHFRQV